MLGTVAMLASCSQDDALLQNPTANGLSTVTITALPEDGMKTRATSTTDDDVTRCKLEIYDGEGNAVTVTPVEGNIYSFSAKLEKDATYTFLCWADDESYDLGANLKTDITAATTGTPGIAYFANESLVASENISLTLKHAVAKVSLKTIVTEGETYGKEASLSFTMYGGFNVEGKTAVNKETEARTITETFSPAAGATDPQDVMSFYALVLDDGLTDDVVISYDSKSTTLDNVPLKRNYHTVFSGNLSMLGNVQTTITATIDQNWESTEDVNYPEAEANANTNTIKTYVEGQLTTDLITAALNGGNELNIAGPMNDADFAVIRSYMEKHNEDEGAELNIDISKTGLTALPKDAFANKDQSIGTGYHTNYILRSVVLPEGLVSIGDYAFHDCDNLTHIVLPASLKSIGEYAFDTSENGAGLKELTIPDGVTYVGNSFLSRTGITQLTIPASLTSFTAGGEFCYMRKLQSLTFEGNVTEVGYITFAYSEALTSIDLSKCEQVPTVRNSNFLFDGIDNPKNIRITVPANLVSGFEAADGWKNATIVAATE